MFKDNLKAARRRKGLTQLQVAEELGMTKSGYCAYEIGKRSPDIEKVKLLAHILDTTPDALLDDSAPESTQSVNFVPQAFRRDLFHDFDQLDEYGRRLIRAIVDIELERKEYDIKRRNEMMKDMKREFDRRGDEIAYLKHIISAKNREIESLNSEIRQLKGEPEEPENFIHVVK